MKQIEISGYKSFKQKQKINLAPITLLVGPNGSGKSTVMDALKLSDGIFDEKGIPNFYLGKALDAPIPFRKKDINRLNKRNEIEFTFPIGLSFFKGNFSVTFKYQLTDGNRLYLKNFHVSSPEIDLLDISVDFEEKENRIIESESNIKIFLKTDIRLIEQKVHEIWDDDRKTPPVNIADFIINPEDMTYEMQEEIQQANDELLRDSIEAKQYLEKRFEEISRRNIYELKSLPKRTDASAVLLSNRYKENLSIVNEFWSEEIKSGDFLLIKEQKGEYMNVDGNVKNEVISSANQRFCDDLLSGAVQLNYHRTFTWIDDLFSSDKRHGLYDSQNLTLNLDNETLGSLNLIFEGLSPKGKFLLRDVLIEDIKRGLLDIKGNLKRENLSANRCNTETRGLSYRPEINKSINQLTNAIEMLNMKTDSSMYFINFWLRQFDMDKSFDIKTWKDFSKIFSDAYDQNNNEQIGFGMMQLLPLLGLLSTPKPNDYWNDRAIEEFNNGDFRMKKDVDELFFSHGKFMMIEEPEANLHPNFQSKFADVLLDSIWKFNHQFLIETHSEYLVRKLQYWVGKGKIAPDQVQIYYFEKDDLNGTKIKPINILKDGSLNEAFGQGFYDEADRISLDLYLLQMAQKN